MRHERLSLHGLPANETFADSWPRIEPAKVLSYIDIATGQIVLRAAAGIHAGGVEVTYLMLSSETVRHETRFIKLEIKVPSN
jgi:hypothetical protein